MASFFSPLSAGSHGDDAQRDPPFEAELLFVLVEELLDFLVRGGRHFGFELFLELADEQRLTGFCPKLLFRQPGFLELFPVVLFGQPFIGNLPLDGLFNFGIRDLDLLALARWSRISSLMSVSRALSWAAASSMG
jgi:hypothetical protein